MLPGLGKRLDVFLLCLLGTGIAIVMTMANPPGLQKKLISMFRRQMGRCMSHAGAGA